MKNLTSKFTTTILGLMLFTAPVLAQAAKAPKASNSDLSLLKTYQRELAFLQAQKRSLLKQRKEIETAFTGKVAKTKKLLTADQDKLVVLTKRNEVLTAKVMDAERNLENLENSNILVETTLLQGKVSLEIPEEKWETYKTQEDKMGFLFKSASEKLASDSQVTTAEGEFFTADGKLVKGATLQVGRIATYGLYNGQVSMLMPAGLGKLKMTDKVLASSFNDLQNTTSSKLHLPIFLYETKAKGIEVKKEKSFMDIVEAGGAIAYVIVGLGLVAMVLVVIRGFLLYSASKMDKSLLTKIQSGDLSEVENIIAIRKTPFDRVLGNIFAARNKEREARENIIHESILGELNFLDKFGAIILVMAAVAPLLGLLGTVTGMISTFDIITEFGTGDPKLLSSGISEALITTKLGLVVAIPSLLLGNLLGGWSGKIKVLLEREALRLSNRFDKDVTNA